MKVTHAEAMLWTAFLLLGITLGILLPKMSAVILAWTLWTVWVAIIVHKILSKED